MPTVIQLSGASHCAFLRLCGAGFAVFHSAYRSTINVLTPKGLVALQRAGSPLSPLSLVTPFDTAGMEALARAARQELRVIPGGALMLGPVETAECCVLECGPHTQFFDPAVPVLSLPALSRLALTARKLLAASDGRGLASLYAESPALGRLNDPVLSAAAGRILQGRDFLAQKKPDRAAEALLGLIGLGSGLTPSGDDFLCGAAAALHAAERTESAFGKALIAGMRTQTQRTNDISAAFLEVAADGLASDAVCALFNIAAPDRSLPAEKPCSPASPDIPALAAKFAAIGHSSGFDSLCGIAAILQYMEDGLL